MWKEEELTAQSSTPTAQDTSAEPIVSAPQSQPAAGRATLGRTVVITGKLSANEDLTIDGRVEGTIESTLHAVTIGQMGLAKAEIFAKEVVVLGKVNGSVTASQKIEIWPNGSVQGDLVSPTVTIAEGATFSGSIDMPRKLAADTSQAAAQPVAVTDVAPPRGSGASSARHRDARCRGRCASAAPGRYAAKGGLTSCLNPGRRFSGCRPVGVRRVAFGDTGTGQVSAFMLLTDRATSTDL